MAFHLNPKQCWFFFRNTKQLQNYKGTLRLLLDTTLNKKSQLQCKKPPRGFPPERGRTSNAHSWKKEEEYGRHSTTSLFFWSENHCAQGVLHGCTTVFGPDPNSQASSTATPPMWRDIPRGCHGNGEILSSPYELGNSRPSVQSCAWRHFISGILSSAPCSGCIWSAGECSPKIPIFEIPEASRKHLIWCSSNVTSHKAAAYYQQILN